MNIEFFYDDGFEHELLTPVSVAKAISNSVPHNISDSPESWRREAYCSTDSQLAGLFFAPAKERPPSREVREMQAAKVCGECSVKKQCRDYAREANEHGFWGGETDDARMLATEKGRSGSNVLRNKRNLLKNKAPTAD